MAPTESDLEGVVGHQQLERATADPDLLQPKSELFSVDTVEGTSNISLKQVAWLALIHAEHGLANDGEGLVRARVLLPEAILGVRQVAVAAYATSDVPSELPIVGLRE